MAETGMQLLKSTQAKVLAQVLDYKATGELVFPENFSPENAIKSAMLVIQQTTDRNSRPAIEVCTQASVYFALLNTVLMGLNPQKDQCYFIVRGKTLCCDPSYHGVAAVAKRVDRNVLEFPAKVVYEDDTFEYSTLDARDYITKHEQKLGNKDKSKIIAAYCVVRRASGDNYAVIMTMDEIKAAWAKSQIKPVDENGNIKANSTHGQYTEKMCCRTVIKAAGYEIIRQSDDANLLVQAFKDNNAANFRAATEEEIIDNENTGEFVDVDYQEVPDAPEDTAPEPIKAPF